MKRKGFTLVELLVVLVIIGILLALIIPNAIKAISQANAKQCASNIRTLDTAIQMYYTDNKSWPSGTGDLLAYLPDEDGDGTGDLPVCPFGVAYALTDTDGDGNNDRADRSGHFSAGNWPDEHD